MPTDAQDTHIMKAHLRKHEVFHNIASALENVASNNSLGDRKHGSQHLVGISFRRLERTGKGKIEKGFPFMLLGDAKSSSLTEALSATRGKSREKHAPPSPAAPTLNTWGDSSGKPRRVMKRHSTKTDLATNRRSGKEGNAPQNPHLTAEKTYLSSLSDSGDCGKRWKLGIHSKIAVEKYRNMRFSIAQNRKQASAWPGN